MPPRTGLDKAIAFDQLTEVGHLDLALAWDQADLGGGRRRDLPKVTVTRIALHRSGAGPSQRLSDHFGLLTDLVDPVDA